MTMQLQKMPATITRSIALSPTAREVTLALPRPLNFLPGAFVNFFIEKEGKKMRRAYSISSDAMSQEEITLSIRRSSPEGVSPLFWSDDIVGREVEIMGPLGLNTIDTFQKDRVFLFGFGIGVSVIKGLLHELVRRPKVREITVVTGSRTEDEILYRTFFEAMALRYPQVRVRFVVSKPLDRDYHPAGYLQDHISDLNFNEATVFLCGQKSACDDTKLRIFARTSDTTQFLVEAFD